MSGRFKSPQPQPRPPLSQSRTVQSSVDPSRPASVTAPSAAWTLDAPGGFCRERLLGALTHLDHLVQELLQLARQKEAALRAGQVMAVAALHVEEEQACAKLEAAEAERALASRAWAQALGLADDAPMSALLRAAGEAQNADIAALARTLSTHLSELQRLNDLNRELLHLGRARAEFVLHALAGPEPGLYGPEAGAAPEPAGPARSRMLDRRA